MAKIDPKYRGQLLPGAAKVHADTLARYREPISREVLKGIKILDSPDCPISKAQAHKVYPIDSVPSLPLTGCVRAPCCACCYSGVVED